MTPIRGGALRRIAFVARATARDLFTGQSTALVILALIGFAVALGDLRAASAAERHVLALRQRLELVVALSATAAVLASAHAVAEERRTLAFARLLTTPLRPFQGLAAKTIGVFAGVTAIAVPIEVALLLVPSSGLLRQRELFAPREQVAPALVETTRPGGERLRWRRGPALLDAGATLLFRFERDAAPELELVLPFVRASGEPGAEPLRWSLSIGGSELLAGRGVDDGSIVAPLSRAERGPVVATLRGLSGDEVLTVDPAACILRGPPGPILGSVARAAAGLVTLVFLASALGAGLAAALPAVLASAAAGCLLLLATLRSLLVDVARALEDPHAHVEPATRAVAAAMERLLSFLPDVARAAAATPISLGTAPWRAADVIALALALAFALAACVAGAAWLRRTAGGVR